ncbi:WecB/TagA/CpsF family glycosyltransferase [candidate division WS5 bacterium]|uniref:WecB/TagA/CpsF family glycosyltransferase n=1 Tax=candidate division WS5 bacterium TaxID=2093353 RepID=A0A419DEJ2_9BACT|nr:MAG: WecB/TagA/CpsF family glycosyltransferase [candidate division WS5 bacterium]
MTWKDMKELTIKLSKKIFGIKFRNSLKIFIFKHPYLTFRESYFQKKNYQNELSQILEKNKDTKGIIFYPAISDWNMPLTQRFNHLARTFSRAGYLFFYGTHNLRYDNVRGFEKIEKNLYLTNQLEVLKDIKDPILYITWAANSFYMKKYKAKSVIYDFVDDLEMFPLLGKKIYKCHNELLDKADIIPVTASRLLDQIKDRRSDAFLSHNAVMFDVWHLTGKKVKPDSEMRKLVGKKPLVGYFGSLIESCFDYDLIKYAAKARPEYNFAISGPLDFDTSNDMHKWSEYPNIHFIGTVPKYEDLAERISFFDVCTVPFILNDVTQSISPLKLFEYMAAGKPIVTTDMRECKKYKSVLASKTKAEFVENLDKAMKLKDDRAFQATILKEAKENTWQARTKKIVELLDECEKKGKKVSILGVEVDKLTFNQSADRALKSAKEKKGFFIVTANAEILFKGAKNEDLKNIYKKADIVTADGSGVVLAGRILGKKLPERVTGVDLAEELLKRGEKDGLTFYFLGATKDIMNKAVKNIKKKYPKLKLVGHQDGGVCSVDGRFEKNDHIINELKRLKPNFIFIGLGCPKQERWIVRHKEELGAVCIGLGGTFRYWSGVEKRAPKIIQKMYLEGVFRLIQNPRRLGRFLVLPRFFYNVVKERIS